MATPRPVAIASATPSPPPATCGPDVRLCWDFGPRQAPGERHGRPLSASPARRLRPVGVRRGTRRPRPWVHHTAQPTTASSSRRWCSDHRPRTNALGPARLCSIPVRRVSASLHPRPRRSCGPASRGRTALATDPNRGPGGPGTPSPSSCWEPARRSRQPPPAP